MDVSQYLEIFIDETKEHLQSLSDNLMVLEKEPENKDTINEIFRAAHSMKGMAGTMGYKRMQKLTHVMEDVFSEVRSDNIKVTADLVDVLFRCLDALEAYLDNIMNSADEGTEDNEEIVNLLKKTLDGGASPEEETAKPAAGQESAEDKNESEDDQEKRKYKNFKFAEFERHAIIEAGEENKNVFAATVYVQENCLLKAARAFLVFKELENLGEIVKSTPSVQDIEDEKFDLDFSICVITEQNEEKVREAILSVSEVDAVYMEKLDTSIFEASASKEEETTKSDTKEESNATASQAAKAAEQKKAPAKAAGSKPVINRSVRVDLEKLDELMNQVSELIIAKNGLVSASEHDASLSSQNFTEQIEYLERITTNLHESVMKVRMMPIESVVNRFPRMIRDLSKKLGKQMDLFMSGEDTELDRTVIDEIGDPLMHLLRNSADHGLESTEQRIALGKPEKGSIWLNAYQDGNNVVIEVQDDGSGINVDKVRDKAIERGIVAPEQAQTMEDKEIVDFLFMPSFSTADKITDVSGRGVGLDVVKSKIEGLGGDIEVRTKKNEGSTFTIRLPLTLAIIQALMIELGEEKYAIPLGSIQTIEDVPIEDIKYVQNKEVIHLRGSVIPLVRLYGLLDCPPREEEPESLTVVIVTKGDKLAGLVVDNLIGQQEIVIKPLGKYIHVEKMISGATILGDGEIALILDANALV
ncbi:MAG: chemotaxis protein CheA [Lachnospira sp.]|nr:chemotaxis protein CheA [Lachnospira sp.]